MDTILAADAIRATMLSVKATRASLIHRFRDDRGDVPGWVLITLMTAGLVIVLWAVAGPALSGVFESALDRVTGF